MNGALETPGRIEPCRIEDMDEGLANLIADVTAAAATLGARLHPRTAAGLADLVRIMNCYYSNLIEGHNTRPRDIERALNHDLDHEEGLRNYQMEAAAHVRLQKDIDARYAGGHLPEPASADFIRWLHREFYRDAPDAMLCLGTGEPALTMVAGEFRSRPKHDNAVGRHHPPSSHRVSDFMAHFESRFRLASMGRGARILAMATAHHRLNYIHPFPDGNGRVSRLMSHAMGLSAGIGAQGLWSVSRGLARGLKSRREYKQMMDYADMPRQGSLDGRGNLSLRALVGFTEWFLKVSLDQVQFMASLFELDRLAVRLRAYVETQERFRPEARRILEDVLLRGEMPRGDAARASGLKERTARTALSDLLNDGILGSDLPKGPVSLRFPVHAVETLFPRLFLQA